ncbi:hypothetical protein [Methylobacterium sp. 77]|uniref:hypothetical protein n=1 Tax=Methylobacterium sp. 77 TaxID=1101192 RepID=UPI0003679797|nr:hypothetical protein [Methylobacterium sp. 77]
MSRPTTRENRIAAIRADLAELAVEVELIRVERVLVRKYSPDQPREPAGQSGGGRWASGSGGPSDPTATGALGSDDPPGAEQAVTEDGSHVLSLRIRSHPSQDWDEQHTVTAPDGTRTVFEMSGRTQTIRDGETGDILSRSTLNGDRAEPEAFVQDARAPMRGPLRIAAAIEAAATLLTVLSQRNGSNGSAIFVAPASEYGLSDDPQFPVFWVGQVAQRSLDLACPRYGVVQEMLDTTTALVRSSGLYSSPQAIGNKVHFLMSEEVKTFNDPNFVAEISYRKISYLPTRYGERNSIRLDILEKPPTDTVCIYDHKTGDAGLDPARAVDFAALARKNFPTAKRFIVVEMRPRR